MNTPLQAPRTRLLLLMLAGAMPALVTLVWLAGQPSSEVLAGYVVPGLIALTLLILALVWIYGATFVLGSMQPVLNAVRRVAGGDLSTRIAMARVHEDEISKLASEVDRMAEALARRDQALTEARDRAQAYLDIVGVMVVAINAKGNIALANRTTCSVLGCKPEDCNPGVNWFEQWLPEAEREAGRALLQRLLAGDEQGTEFHEGLVRTAKKQERLVAWHNRALRDPSGRIIGMLSSGEDITERRQLQAEQERLQAQLQQAQKMEALGHLTGGIAHDFNNILASVLGFAKLALRRHAPDPAGELAEYMREIIVAGERARDLVSKMLAFGRAQPGHAARPIAPAPLLDEAVKMLSATIPAGIRIDIDPAQDLPDIAIDPVAFHQMLLNLLINARDALNGSGHIRIGLRRRRVEQLNCSACHHTFSGDYLELTVTDDGQGIAPEVMPHIFEPFFTTKAVGKGSGMGLAMVHGLVRRADGHFEVTSEPGSGTTFRIFLPAAAPAAYANAPVAAAAVAAGGKRKHVLVVDDEAAILRLLESGLQAADWRVSSFNDPILALTAFRATPYAYDGVISDYSMPGMTGSEMILAMRELRPDFGAILCSGYSDRLDAETAREMGIGYFFLKPVDTDLLLTTLATLNENAGPTTDSHRATASRARLPGA